MTAKDIKIHLHEKIELLNDTQVKKLYSLFSEFFPEKQESKTRTLGRMPGLIKYMAPDFDKPLEDLKDYIPA